MWTTIEPNKYSTVTNEPSGRRFTVSTVLTSTGVSTVAFEETNIETQFAFTNGTHSEAVRHMHAADLPVTGGVAQVTLTTEK